ncbi:MAG: HEAT repeat domain-containing protein [Gemmatimonadaceae bacterium]|nr:HEAT repeat domain-containing protein [Gemmatimonadaceae bacterium]NUO96289.1 HEAT repeat domain-containing protein [Gemmatimonadaceae bacterium]NUS34657.1 HEAT repeat domain-containing protein [Gemmatimonadaceae bacterium]
MDYSVTFARHFARLVWLLTHEPANVDEQKAVLRALVTVAREGFISLGARMGTLTANGTALPPALSGVAEIVARLSALGAGTLDVDRNASAGDIIRAARLLAAPGSDLTLVPGATVRFAIAPAGEVDAPLVDASRAASLPEFDFGEMIDDPIAAALERATPVRSQPAQAPPPPAAKRRVGGGGMFDHFSTESSSATDGELLARFDAERSPDALIGLLGELAARAEQAMGAGRAPMATEIFHRIVRREHDAQESDVKRAFVLAVKRLTKPALLQAVVTDLTRSPDEHARAKVVLARTGEEGADAVIERLAAEEGRKARLLFFDVLVQLHAGVPTLLHMLGDARWYVARNAAALLGEMQARDAEKPLTGLLHHDDERVRHAAIVALMRLGTARSMPTIQEGLRDRAPQIRMQAAAALVGRKERNVPDLLLRALDDERDDEVAAAFLLALGRLGTPDAVARLIATAEADRGLFRRKPVALRVAAVQALAEVDTEQARAALTALQGDKDEDVRATAVYALGRRSRMGG